MNKRAFTLLELLTVMAVIVVLGAIASPAVRSVLTKAKIVKCEAQIVALAAVMEAYKVEYGNYPRRHSGGLPIYTDAHNNHDTLNPGYSPSRHGWRWLQRMKGEDTNPAAGSYDWPNPRGIKFLEAVMTDTKTDGLFIVSGRWALADPWGNGYAWIMDGDMNGHIRVDTNNANWRPLDAAIDVWNKPYIIMSKGPDPTDPSDNIYSWK